MDVVVLVDIVVKLYNFINCCPKRRRLIRKSNLARNKLFSIVLKLQVVESRVFEFVHVSHLDSLVGNYPFHAFDLGFVAGV